MLKSVKKTKDIKGNIQKYRSYQEAWIRINESIKEGFYFEAITIEESIIFDRIYSNLVGNKKKGINKGTRFSKLIEFWNEQYISPIKWKHGKNLQDNVDEWRKERNEKVHGIAKSEPGQATIDIKKFIRNAKSTAIKGRKLTRAVSNWHRQELKKFRRSQKVSN